jgi:uncharacterized membrane protein
MLERLFQFLFKYRPVVFEQGRLGFESPWPVTLVLLLGAAAAGIALVVYARTRQLERRDRLVLTSLRIAALAILTLCLVRPILVIATVVPQQNFLGILIDDSRSMTIADQDEQPRSDYVLEHFANQDGALLQALSERFKLRFFRFSETVARLQQPDELTFAGRRSDLGRALESARRELGAVPLAGLVLVTDGADNAESSLTDALLQVQAAGVPVHTVGLGSPRFDRDIALERVTVPRTVLEGSSVAVDLTVTHRGLGGETIRVTVEDGGRIVAAEEIRLSRNAEADPVRTHFVASEPGPRVIRFHVAPVDGEVVRENNTIETLLVVEDDRRRVLYFEGEPRFEVKFVRRAVADDENLRVVVLQRTAEDKFYRIDVDNPDELAAGFPTTREELFRYHGLILGSVEASFFTHDQLAMIGEFVSRRGGGLLALGGRLAFARGGYAGTAVAEALPVHVDSETGSDTGAFFAEVSVEPTPLGRAHPVTQLAPSMDGSEARWKELPAVSMLNAVRGVKPGASTLLLGRSGESRDPLVVLAYQRYGRGKALAFPVQDSWIWQMHADIPLEDQTHETFWRQLLRWLVTDVPNHVSVSVSTDRVERDGMVSVTADVSDSGYVKHNGADVTATVTSPSGAERRVPMEWTVQRDGEYRALFVADEDGLYDVQVDAWHSGVLLGGGRSFVQAGDLQSEYFGAEMHESLLERIADETGGRFYTPETVSDLPEDVSFTESGTTVQERRDLWDMPVLFLVLLTLIGVEWGYRRYRGLA